jgi:hypothetical protein
VWRRGLADNILTDDGAFEEVEKSDEDQMIISREAAAEM